jgi:hypothetical protein
MNPPILAPAAVLVLWSIVVLFWVFATRMKAFSDAGIDLGSAEPGVRYADVESQMPESVNWKSHNFTHLMEQPTLFYALVAILAIAGQGDGFNAMLAWAYALVRILHSLWQSTINTIPVRFGLYLLSTFFLLVLAVSAVGTTAF